MQNSELTLLEEKLRHSILIDGQSREMNLRTGALDLFRRAVNLDEAIRTLNLDYTYEIIDVPEQKRESRKQLGKMVVPILEAMRDELLNAGFIRFTQSRGLQNGGQPIRFGDEGSTKAVEEGASASSDEAQEVSGQALERGEVG